MGHTEKGYSSLNAEMIARAKAGAWPCDIAVAMGMEVATVSAALSRARSNGEDIPKFPKISAGATGASLKVPIEIIRQVVPARPNMDWRSTVIEILETVVEDDLIDAVLDDAG